MVSNVIFLGWSAIPKHEETSIGHCQCGHLFFSLMFRSVPGWDMQPRPNDSSETPFAFIYFYLLFLFVFLSSWVLSVTKSRPIFLGCNSWDPVHVSAASGWQLRAGTLSGRDPEISAVGLLDGLLGVAGMMTLRKRWLGSFPKIPCVKRTSKLFYGNSEAILFIGTML